MLWKSSLRLLPIYLLTLLCSTPPGICNGQEVERLPVTTRPSAAGAGLAPLGKISDEVDRVLCWLPGSTESLLVSHGTISFETGPPAIIGPMGAARFDRIPAIAFEDLAAEECIGPLADLSVLYPHPLRDRMVQQIYGLRTAVLFAKALSYDKEGIAETSDIVVFSDNTAKRKLEHLTSVPSLRQDYLGIHVFKVDLNDGQVIPADHRWFASPSSTVFLATTSESLMKELVERMNRPGSRQALPSDLPEWQQLAPGAPAWGIRHYRGESADSDKTSMLKRDPNAKGLVLFCGGKPETCVRMRYISKSDDAGSRFMQMRADWRGMRKPKASFLARMQRISGDAVEERLRTNVSQEEALRDEMAMTVYATNYSVHMTYLPLLGFP